MDLSTNYMGLALAHPVVPSASPLTATVDGILKLEDAGAAAIVTASIYEEQIEAQEAEEEVLMAAGAESHAEVGAYFPVASAFSALDERLNVLRRAAERTSVPIIASLNGASVAGWLNFATKLEQAGASAIELNFTRIPTDIDETGVEVEAYYADVVRRVAETVAIPVSVKMPPFFSAPGNVARKLLASGAKGLVLFNRFYGPGLDVDNFLPEEDFTLSNSHELRLTLMWTGLLSRRLEGTGGTLAASTGVWSGADVIKCLLAGADAVMTTSSLLRLGPAHIGVLLAGVREWMERQDHEDLTAFKGMLAAREPGEARRFLREEYRRLLTLPHPRDFAIGPSRT
ncbi:MAG: dihydroorotate dehydrogenase-like protein [Acetobacter sp.]|nr:dihydroorotate dehydrogenase-like protein [Acetobacter sp.]MCH4060126.1 dihydroorotate dehydrogenase-like protein [Acetobacter sp.]MCH4087066.1 dihydroorotate dehydrogenase-like protein [Acetobacter sp.]MCI1292886.1 dihydroorotate dehydrogenase-like protein [Acetobacter sp.]MCI1319472.1 dihydroorotate dehydrogenase-like protein [Acetobacter sp.]